MLQCLIGTSRLENDIDKKTNYNSDYPLHATLKSIFECYRSAEVEYTPSALCEILSRVNIKYSENKQEDAAEALNQLLSKTMEEEVKLEKKKFCDTLLGNIFGTKIATRSI